ATVIAVTALAGMILPLRYWHRTEEIPPVLRRPSGVTEGIVSAEWRRRLYPGERLEIRGEWRGRPGSGPVKLLLMGFGTVVDSVRTTGAFSLSMVPPQTGRAEYQLAAVKGRDTIEKEAIPVEVGLDPPMKILILAASPDFENAFLVNWLAKNGQRVAVRTKVSRDKYQTSYVNMKPRPLGRLTRALLDGFDVVIADEEVWTGPERSVLRLQVEKKELGLIIKTDSGLLRREPVGVMVLDTVWGENATYIRLMKGQAVDYSKHWAELLRLVARPKPSADQWSWEPVEPKVGDEVDLTLQTAAEAPQGTMAQDGRAVSVYLAEDAVLPFVWHGRYWPEKAGWVRVNDSGWLYVWPRGSWPAMGGREPVAKAASVKAERDPARVEEVPVSKYWMYTAFLLSIFFLWVERKFN
ncbi:MAG TPA: hypothetical protein VNV35_20540, partial [Puia sp.]|nr:hypothetical protein [Puia sp.]